MSNVSAFMYYHTEKNRHNITIDMQGFISPPSFGKKSKMADKDGHE